MIQKYLKKNCIKYFSLDSYLLSGLVIYLKIFYDEILRENGVWLVLFSNKLLSVVVSGVRRGVLWGGEQLFECGKIGPSDGGRSN